MGKRHGLTQTKLWIWWGLLLAALGLWLGQAMMRGEDRTLFMPGPLSDGHHQLAMACEACHGEGLGGEPGSVAALQQSCLDCHGEERRKPMDSHPRAKFTDPRNAELLANVDALHCVSCHSEHRPEITLKDGLTQPVDLCFHCHSDIAEDRPSHQGMAFTTCKDAGCHNFHNNRAIYTDFLVKHSAEAELLARPQLPQREYAGLLDEVVDYPRERYPLQALDASAMDAPTQPDRALQQDWLASRHAAAGVNCTACHEYAVAPDAAAVWTDHPDQRGCVQCHGLEVQRFQRGKHGMRLAAGLPPMTPAEARLPMKAEAAHESLTCHSCHGAHDFELRQAAVESCLACHDDDHSRAYRSSAHFERWQQELAGESAEGSGVSCAGCHMPRINFDVNEWSSRIMVDHNQSANLSPNSKMARSTCIACHGLGFSLDALADRDLIERNFSGRPTGHVRSIELAVDDQQRALRETAELEE